MPKAKANKDHPIETWASPDGWTWRVLRKVTKDETKPHAVWYCYVTSPYCPDGEYGDTYVANIKQGTVWHAPAVKEVA